LDERTLNKEGSIVVCGCHEAGWHTIKFLLDKGLRINYLVTLDQAMADRNKVSGFKDYTSLAKEYGIPVFYVKSYSLTHPHDVAFFETNRFDLLIQGGWQRLFPENVLKSLKVGAIGVHGSSDFLPEGRGRSPINWSLIEGKKRFILHYFMIKPGVDDGNVFHYEMFDINEWDTCKTLYYKNSLITRKVLLEWIPKLLNNDFSTFRQEGVATYYPKRTAEDGLIDWMKNVFQLYDFIRGITKPYPGAFSFVNGRKATLWQACPFDTRINFPNSKYGEVVELFDKNLIINCRSGLLLVTDYECDFTIKKGDQFISR